MKLLCTSRCKDPLCRRDHPEQDDSDSELIKALRLRVERIEAGRLVPYAPLDVDGYPEIYAFERFEQLATELEDAITAKQFQDSLKMMRGTTGIVLRWRQEGRVGCIQAPIASEYPAITFLSITSRYIDPEFVRAVRNLDPARVQLIADDRLELQNGNFHIVRREGDRLTFMSFDETAFIETNHPAILQIEPAADGIVVTPILHRQTHWEQKPENN